MSQVNIFEELSNFIFISKYARYDEKKKRRETWEEAVDRVLNMHLKRYSFLSKEDKEKVNWAFDLVREKRVLPSMRSLQFAGKAVETKNSRIYNCCTLHVDSIRSFAEIFYLMLCGCGTGIGLSKQFINRLPNLVNENDKTGTIITYQIEDTVEGWADSIEALMTCYLKNTPFSGRKIVFDYSKIRPKGAFLKTSGGKAPGFKGLKNAHIKVKKLLDYIIEVKKQDRLKTIDIYDILMHCADAVLSGGIRRSASCVIFQKDDLDMINAKTHLPVEHVYVFHKAEGGLHEGYVKYKGEKIEVILDDPDFELLKHKKLITWWHVEPQRRRSNNSVLLIRNETKEEELQNIIEKCKLFGEPGFVFGNHKWQLFNPCQPSWAKLLTKNGIRQLKDININDEVWSSEGWTKVINKWSTGIKSVYEYRTTAGCFYGTENHKLISNKLKVEAKDCESIDILCGPYFNQGLKLSNQDIIDGLVIGDGSVHEASNDLVHLCIGKDDYDYFNSEIKDLIVKHRPGLNDYAYEVKTSIIAQELPKTYDRIIPDRFFYGNREKIYGFLRGLYSANGSICGNRITLKSSSFALIEQVQTMLSSIGIKSYYTTNKSHSVKFSNGEYLCKESYDLNISTDRLLFYKSIGFIQNYKNEKLMNLIKKDKQKIGKLNYEIIEVNNISNEEVFDITVDNLSHTYWTQGCNVSNCFEINFIPVTEDGVCGVQFCNLTTMNGRLIDNKEKFKECAEAATIIGTLQAGYTEFPYLRNISEKITREEALLGVSITGMMENPDILLNPKIQKEVAEYTKEINKTWAEKIFINPAARVTCIKPEGTGSLFLGTSSGIHAHHAKKYFRRVTCNKIESPYVHFKKYNFHMCQESVNSPNGTDDVVTFPLSAKDGAIVKNDLTAIKHLEIIKSTQENWVRTGTTEFNKKPITNSVSCTVIVENQEWEEVCKYIYKNRDYFSAVSFIPKIGDKLYKQAPNEAVLTKEEEEIFESLIANIKNVNYKEMREEEDNTVLSQELACGGNNCEVK